VPLAVENISQWAIGLIYISAILLFVKDKYSAGTIIAMAGFSGAFWQPILRLANIYNSVINVCTYLERIFDTLEEKVDIIDSPNAYALPPIKGNVEFIDVCFSYEENRPVLKNVSFKINAGESVALVGETGSGKTTIVNLLSRFYEASSGKILIDGHDIKKVTLSSLRNQMGIMMQDSFLFSGNIQDNVRYGKLDATKQEIINACKNVGADKFIENIDDGYNTTITEKGSNFSQGQRQLISFARTAITDPAILILDEATSCIDSETERLVQEGLNKLLKGRTSFIVAHRLSTIINCDKIIFVKDGEIAEMGSHKQLIEQKGLYYLLYSTQQS
jgi:ATP-binding cassette subfamily B multidrug efflux pump